MKKFIILLLPLLFASCYKEVDITTLDITSTVEPAYTTANVSAESNIASSNLNLRIHLATNSDMDQNLQTIELGDAKEGYCQKVISNLTDGTTYYYQLEGYSNSTQKQFDIGSFTTLKAEPPTVTTTSPTNITGTMATSGGEVTFDGGLSVSARGVCWSTNDNPTISNSHSTNGTGTGSFTSYLTGLSAKTTYYVRAYATNAKGTSYGNTEKFTTEAVAPTVTTNNVTNITTSTATCGGNVTATGGANVTARGVCWSTSTNPTISNSHTTNGTDYGTFTSNITGLSAGTTYYVRAYATNSAGTSYGSQVSFTASVAKPTVTTTAISNITATSATSGGNVTSTGGANVTARGVCWSTSANPTISNSHTTNGTGSGAFTSNLTGLSANTTYYVRAYATNSAGTSYGSQVTFTTSKSKPTVTTTAISNITATSATSGGDVTATGGASVTARGVCWSTGANPTISNSHTTNGTGSGTFTSNITGLTAGTTYYVRAYATNSAGTSYGSQVTFTTSTSKPTVTTTAVSNITTISATSGGNVTATGGASVTARGVCWSTSANPTISNSHTTNGTGSGNFSSSITGLTAGTTYYVRAYATNSAGTSYGSQVSFTTSSNPPTVTTTTVSNITATSATSGGNVTATGGASVTARGVCWSTSANPTISNSHTTNGTGTGSFTSNLTGLSANTTYYVRAYATNSAGTAYGSQMTFTTAPPPSYQDITVNGYTFRMKHVEGGTFNMGAQSTNPSGANYDPDAYDFEGPVHSVTLSGFYIGETEVTQGLWEAVMGVNVGHGTWYSSNGLGSNYPAYNISYNDAQTFITQLNSLTGRNFRMLTEAEWEYAARGGNQSQGYKYSGSNTIDNVAWYSGNGNHSTHPVKGKAPNELGIYDMSGNVRELCNDWWDYYSSSSQTNPTGPTTGTARNYRGGDCEDATACRVSYRNSYGPSHRGFFTGFRLALSE